MVKTEANKDRLPVDAKTGQARTPVNQPGYYPGFETLSQKNFWDAATREAVEQRVYRVPEIRFFTAEELPLMTAVCDRILPQDDRVPESKIPIVNYIDERLFKKDIGGYRYEDMPPDDEAHRLGLQAIDQTAQAIHATCFIELDALKQDFILKSIHDGKKLAAPDVWARLPIDRYWQLLVQDCVAAYYSHPYAWDEIGFGGPAYPRAYTRLEGGLPEPWEVDEKRYQWSAPSTSISDRYEETGAGSHTTTMGREERIEVPTAGCIHGASRRQENTWPATAGIERDAAFPRRRARRLLHCRCGFRGRCAAAASFQSRF